MPPEDSRPVKKEELEGDDDEQCLGSYIRDKGKKKPVTSNAASKLTKANKEENADFDTTPKKPAPKAVKPKKEENAEFDLDDVKSGARKSAAKDDKSKSKKKEEVKDKKSEGEVKKKERKVYDLPGQKRDPPEERDPLRIFYESLYEQVPESEMAAIWMMESGLLPKDIAKQVFERKQKRSQMQKLGSPMKPSVSAAKRATQSAPAKKTKDSSSTSSAKKATMTATKASTATKTKKRKKDESSEEEDEDSDDDFDVPKMVSKKQRTT